jgi:hypothetical protein
LNREALEANTVSLALLEYMNNESEWSGTPSELLKELVVIAESLKIDTKQKEWPKAPQSLTRKLNEVKTNLEDENIEIEYDHDGNKRIIKIMNNSVNSVNSVIEEDIPTIKMTNGIKDNSVSKDVDSVNSVRDLTVLTINNAIKNNTVSEGITHKNDSDNAINDIYKNEIEKTDGI